MDTHNHHIDDFFKNELGNLEIVPPECVWKNIEDKLDKKRKIRILMYRISMAASLALFVGLGSLYFTKNQSSNIGVAEISQKSNKNKSNNRVQIENSLIIAESQTRQGYNLKQEKKINIVNEKQLKANTIEEKSINTDVVIINSNQSEGNKPEKLSYIQPKPAILASNKNIAIDEVLLNNTSSQVPSNIMEPLVATNEISKPKRHRWSIEAQFAPQYSYRTLTGSSAITNKSDYKETEDGLLAYNGGLKVNFEVNRRLSVQAGAAFSIMGQTLKDLYVIKPTSNNNFKTTEVPRASWVNNSLGDIVNGSGNTIYNISMADNTSQVTYFNKMGISMEEYALTDITNNSQSPISSLGSKIVQQLKVIEIPLLVRYKLINKRIGLHILGGLSTNILIGSNALFKDGSSTTKFGKTIGLKPYNYTGTAGFGVSYSLSRRVSLQFEPTFKYYLNYIAEKNGYRYHPYSYAMFTGIRYQF